MKGLGKSERNQHNQSEMHVNKKTTSDEANFC